MDGTLAQLLTELYQKDLALGQAAQTIDKLKARVTELEAQSTQRPNETEDL